MSHEQGERDQPAVLPTVPAGSGPDRVLRESMRVLRDRTTDPEARALFDDVLHGRRSARALLHSDAFGDYALRGLREYEEKVADMTPEQRARLEAAGERALDDPRG